MPRSSLLLTTTAIVLAEYMMFIGGTLNGLLLPRINLLSLAMLAGVLGYWLVRRQKGWHWYTTPLDRVFFVWAAAFAISLLANSTEWRRIAVGLWYMGLYIGVWFVLSDLLMNKGISRETIVNALLWAGAVTMLLGYLQTNEWIGQWIGLLADGVFTLDLPRPGSTLMNSNVLGGFLALLLPFVLSRLMSAQKWLARVIMTLYLLALLLLILLASSRGAWLGLGAGFIVWLGLILAHYQLLSMRRLRTWWISLNRNRRWLFSGFALAVLSLALVMGLLLARSLVMRGLTGREPIYAAAWQGFIQKPLTGHGLFTFGHVLAQGLSFPPDAPHAHAHNGILHIAAELGLPGLLALTLTMWVVARAMRRYWVAGIDRFTLCAAIAAVVTVVVHHLTDFIALMPAAALAFLAVLCVACLQMPSEERLHQWRGLWVYSLWGVLFVTGLWSTKVYNDYNQALFTAFLDRDFTTAAYALDTVIAQDPAFPAYVLQQAFLYGMAANEGEGDLEAARLGAETYTRFLEMQPNYAFAWANLAALRWQLGENDNAIAAARQATELAPRAAPYWMLLGDYLEENGDLEGARLAYAQAVSSDPDIVLLKDWGSTPLQTEIATAAEPSRLRQTLELIENRQAEEALAFWQSEPNTYSSSVNMVLQALAAGANGDYVTANHWLIRAELVPSRPDDGAWVHLGTGWVARWQGDIETFASELEAARSSLTVDPLEAGSYWQGSEIMYYQYIRLGVPRLLLPQTGFPRYNPLLWYLIAQ